MLSRNSWIWNGTVSSFVEASDNNSVVFETKSSSTNTRDDARKNDHNKCVYDQDEKPRTKKRAESENSYSEYFLGENGKAESDGSVEGFLENGNCKRSTSKMSLGAWLDERRTDEKKGINRTTKYLTESRKDLSKKFERGGYGLASNSDICESRKGTTDRSYLLVDTNRATKKINDYSESTYETGENSLGADHNDPKCINIGNHEGSFRNKTTAVLAQDMPYEPEEKVKPKKSKGHKCPPVGLLT
ncbi:hypothetical protein K7X08_035997 [Anisodus acutangulus]|uniref:Uncharacterized protein n=1 Tax=Anisodus acutangulus TaxID=402998 RepID=A0A9Q1L7G9_9SOLA|nr:hypothetical protein K7X08_035997 [Anisodus acutangulus]